MRIVKDVMNEMGRRHGSIPGHLVETFARLTVKRTTAYLLGCEMNVRTDSASWNKINMLTCRRTASARNGPRCEVRKRHRRSMTTCRHDLQFNTAKIMRGNQKV